MRFHSYVIFINRKIGLYGKFNDFFRKCVNVGNTNAVYYDGFQRAIILGLDEDINVLEANVPTHAPSKLVVGIFNVCLGNDKEVSRFFDIP